MARNLGKKTVRPMMTMVIIIIISVFYYSILATKYYTPVISAYLTTVTPINVESNSNNNNNNAKTSTRRIPRNVLFNSKDGIKKLSNFIQSNIEHSLSFFPGWQVIDDDDNSCLQKIQSIDLFKENSTTVVEWFNSKSTKGMFKSDLCRLAQLYLDGGIYMDNDIELSASLEDILSGADVVTALAFHESAYFQAILASSKGNHFIYKNLELFNEHIEGRRVITRLLGPGAMIGAMMQAYNITYIRPEGGGLIDREQMLKQNGVYLLKEAHLPSNHTMMKYRTSEKGCRISIDGILEGTQPEKVNFDHDERASIYGFSRVKRYGTDDAPCSSQPFQYD